MLISKSWAMSNHETFKIKPIKELIEKYISNEKIWIDPFARNSIFNPFCKYTNDLNPEFKTTHNLEALSFLKTFADETVDGVLFDPPYSFRQIKECYNGIGLKVFQEDTQSIFYSHKKDEISRITKKDALVISCGWNSGGIGKNRGFDMIEILLVAHGGSKNDTIITVERKI